MSEPKEWWKPGIPIDDLVNAQNMGTVAKRRGAGIGKLIHDAITQVYAAELALAKDFNTKYPYADSQAEKETA